MGNLTYERGQKDETLWAANCCQTVNRNNE